MAMLSGKVEKSQAISTRALYEDNEIYQSVCTRLDSIFTYT